VTGLLTTSCSQFQDWSAAYRLFSKQRLSLAAVFSVVRRAVAAQLGAGEPFRAAIDDTLLHRSGLHTPGVGWRRDPLGPPFQTNFVRAQRFLQVSAALSAQDGGARMVPIAFRHTPTLPKPSRKASAERLTQYRTAAHKVRLSLRGAEQIRLLRDELDQDPGGADRVLWMSFDGGYTNATVLKAIPPRTTCIGRIRKDARLYFPPDPALLKARGRRPCYGAPAPTPEQLRCDDSQPWQSMPLRHSGVDHTLRFKCLQNVLWRTAGATQQLQLVVLAPLAYRLRKSSKLLYRDPAFLICTDPTLDPRQLIPAFLARWDIEVNFRDEKTLLGTGQAQVRSAPSVESAPALSVASYAMLLVAAQRAFADSHLGLLPQPKWAATTPTPRLSTQRLLHQLRAEVWGRGLGFNNFSGFALPRSPHTKLQKCSFPIASAVCYANG
jgi:hypothetical protein